MDTSKQPYRVIRIDCVAGGAMGEGDTGPRDLPVPRTRTCWAGGESATQALAIIGDHSA